MACLAHLKKCQYRQTHYLFLNSVIYCDYFLNDYALPMLIYLNKQHHNVYIFENHQRQPSRFFNVEDFNQIDIITFKINISKKGIVKGAATIGFRFNSCNGFPIKFDHFFSKKNHIFNVFDLICNFLFIIE
ncbi:hypothetical protein BpHYR1_051231 [Brachionus plicatilis]|uniref:Uncharacterized protein n=1 Tax=Brachionus plicatilis TaxID=10195 RepID=A0A3M7RMF4_BRAPC|nr:hypothetical protein BpHYR1_051231 [Brachionus plicatilis]